MKSSVPARTAPGEFHNSFTPELLPGSRPAIIVEAGVLQGMKNLKRWVVGLAFAAVAVAQTPPSTKSFALPQLVFGGGWYTAIYFNNQTNGALAANVSFFDQNGQPLPTTLLNSSVFGSGLAAELSNADTVTVSTTTVSVPAQGTAIIEAPNSGSLQQGWARVDVPAGMVGYGIFRYTLSVPGQPTQLSEGEIPFANTSSTVSSLIFDDTAYVTAVAFANPSSVAASINITALNAAGQTIGTATQPLGAGARTAVVLRNFPGLAAVAGQRGTVQFTATTGAVSVLGLRFNNLTFTSIPPFTN